MRRPTAAPLAPEEVERLLRACGRKSWRAARNRALLVVLCRAGLRSSEVCGQLAQDVRSTPNGLVLRVSKPKGFARGAPLRELGLDKRASELLARWLEMREPGAAELFVTRPGAALSTSFLRAWLPRLARRAQLARRVHPHCLRATFARQLYDEGIGIREIQLALGHKNLNTTAVYLASIGAHEAVAATQNREW